jgi:hypothetical protein
MGCRQFKKRAPLYVFSHRRMSPNDLDEVGSHMAICANSRDHHKETPCVLHVLSGNREIIRRTEQEEVLTALQGVLASLPKPEIEEIGHLINPQASVVSPCPVGNTSTHPSHIPYEIQELSPEYKARSENQ